MAVRHKASKSAGFHMPANGPGSVYKKKRDGQSHPVLSLGLELVQAKLEEELHGKLQNASSLLLRRISEIAIGLGKRLRHRILLELQGQVTPAREGIQRMVQPVIGFNPELKFLRFRDGKVLEQRHVPVEERWSVGHREQRWAILARGHRRLEAGRVDVLVRGQVC